MKVYIGPYREWIGPYQIADKIFFWLDHRGIYDDEEYDRIMTRWDHKLYTRFGDWLASTWVNDFCNWLDKFKKRKIKIQIDPYDTWSMDHTLSMIVHPMLIQLRDTNHGYGFVDPEDAPPIGKGDDDNGSDTKAEERWAWVMEELIWTFDQLANKDDFEQFYKDGVWDNDAREKNDQRIANGLRLFGKYYRSLWD